MSFKTEYTDRLETVHTSLPFYSSHVACTSRISVGTQQHCPHVTLVGVALPRYRGLYTLPRAMLTNTGLTAPTSPAGLADMSRHAARGSAHRRRGIFCAVGLRSKSYDPQGCSCTTTARNRSLEVETKMDETCLEGSESPEPWQGPFMFSGSENTEFIDSSRSFGIRGTPRESNYSTKKPCSSVYSPGIGDRTHQAMRHHNLCPLLMVCLRKCKHSRNYKTWSNL
jgi:hypothetical protein